MLVLHEGGTQYLAVFNFAANAVTKSIDLARAGLDASTTYAVTDLWYGVPSSARGTLSTTLDAHFAQLSALQ